MKPLVGLHIVWPFKRAGDSFLRFEFLCDHFGQKLLTAKIERFAKFGRAKLVKQKSLSSIHGYQATLQSGAYGFRPASDFEFLQHVSDVDFDGALADVQCHSDFFIALAFGQRANAHSVIDT